MQGNLPTAKTCMGQPEDAILSDQEEFGKVTSSTNLLVFGFPPPASFLRVSHFGKAAHSTAGFAQLGIFQVKKGNGGME